MTQKNHLAKKLLGKENCDGGEGGKEQKEDIKYSMY